MATASHATIQFNRSRPTTKILPSSSLITTTRVHFQFQRFFQASAGGLESVTSSGRPTEDGDAIRRLQNGPDVRGVALEGEKGRAVNLTPQVVEAISESFGEWVVEKLRSEGGSERVEVRVSVGRDPRVSGPSLSAAVFGGLARAGCRVFDMGLATTPACFVSTMLAPFQYDASVMVYGICSSHCILFWSILILYL